MSTLNLTNQTTIDSDIVNYLLKNNNMTKSEITKIILPKNISIGDNSFKDFNNLTTIDWFHTITSIGSHAFDGCQSLLSIDPVMARYIGDYAFANCTGLTYAKVMYLNKYQFYNCANLQTCILPKNSKIPQGCFLECSALNRLDWFHTVTSIGSHAFEDCISLQNINTVNVTNIDSYAFKKCININNIKVDICTKIGNYAFDGCTNFPSQINLPNCTEIGRYAFRGCKNLESLIAPNCTFVDYNAFYDTKLWDVDPS